jgi:hypothetical protein
MSRRAAIALTVASLVSWSAWELGRTAHPYADLAGGWFTDHFSHESAARAFPRLGLGLWRHPVDDQLRRLDSRDCEALPADVRPACAKGQTFEVPGWPADKPYVQSWTDQPRLYPPGDLVLFAPLAALYHFTRVSFATSNRLLIVLCLLFAHVAFYFLVRALSRLPAGERPVAVLVALALYGPLVFYALQGFYDAVTIVPLVLCGSYLAERRAVAAAVAFCVAATLHFRAFFLAPLALYALWLFVQDRAWRRLSWRDLVGVGAVLVLAVLALGSFALVAPELGSVRLMSLLRAGDGALVPAMVKGLGLLVLLGAAALAWAGAWLDVLVLAWLALCVVATRQTLEWHTVVPAAWLGLPVLQARADRRALVAPIRLAVFVTLAAVFFHTHLDPSWLLTPLR